jgi:signal transduction histidine kinase
MSIDNYRIRTNSHIINLLGDELIGSDSLALFEIVKNSYDADASVVTISLNNLFKEDRSIVIEDDGNGMTPEVIEHAWLTIGTDYKRKSVKVSPVLHRTSLGNKGVGRLAVHRLANRIMLETQPRDYRYGSRLNIDWDVLISSSEDVEGLSVNVENNIQDILDGRNGTRITLTQLREESWTKSKVTQMVRKLQNIINPFSPSNQFQIVIKSNNHQVQQWINSVRTPVETLKDCLYQYSFTLEKSGKENGLARFSWHYKFNPKNFPPSTEIEYREDSRVEELLINGNLFHEIDMSSKDKMLLRDSDLDGIESIHGNFYAFNLDGKIVDLSYGSGNRGKIKEFVSEYAGVRVFRDGIRVYNYGEPADDWLYLDQAKTKRVGSHFAKGQTVGAINLSLEETKDCLKEKTNREGFIENACFERLVAIVQTIFGHFERLSIKDREKINAYQHDTVAQRKIGFSETVDQLEDSIKKLNLERQLGSLVKKVRRDYDDMRDVMLNSGMSGLNLTVVFHEVSREMAYIGKDITKRDCDIENIRQRIVSLNDLIEKFMPMLKQTRKITLTASNLAGRVISIHKNRFSYHHIRFDCPLLEKPEKDFKINGVGGLLLSALSNIIDNAIYWTCENAEREGGGFEPSILLTTDLETFDGPALVVADNGGGFKMDEDEMILPFRTLKPSSMGVGLYYVSLVMNMVGGKLIFTNRNDLNLPAKYSGACVALVFPKN